MAQKNAGKIDFMSDYQTEKEKKLKKEILKSQQESAKIKLQTSKSTAPKTDSDIIQEYESIPEYNILQRGFSGNTTRGTGRAKTTEALAYEKKQSLYPEYRQAKNRQIGKFLSENGIDDDALDKAFAKDRSTLNTSVKTNLSIPVGVTSGYIDLKKIADKAGLSMDDLQDYYNAKKSGEFVDKAVDFADEHGVLGTGASVATNLLGTAATVPTETVNYLTGKPIGSNEEVNNYGRVTGEMRGAVKENISESIDNPVLDSIANFGYDVGTSIGDMGSASIIGGGPAGALAIMSASAGANTLNEAKDRNLTPDQMMGTAIASGTIEAITEKIPLDNLFKIAKTQGRQCVKQILKNALKQAGTEASEEAISELANSFVDTVVNGDESEWNQSVNMYMLYGMTQSQAEKQAKKDLAGRALQSALAGAVSGGIMAGGAGVIANSKSDIITPEQFQANNEYIQKLKEINDGKSYLDSYNDRLAQDNAAKLVPLKNVQQNNEYSEQNKVPESIALAGLQSPSLYSESDTSYNNSISATSDMVNSGHTKEQLKVMEDYRNSSEQDIVDFINKARDRENNYVRPIIVTEMNDSIADYVMDKTGIDIHGNSIVLNRDSIRHIDSEHGDAKNGKSIISDDDLSRIKWVLDNADEAAMSNDVSTATRTKDGKPAPHLFVRKRIDGHYYVVEAVSDGKKKMNVVISAFIEKAGNEKGDVAKIFKEPYRVSNASNVIDPSTNVQDAHELGSYIDSIPNSVENVNEGSKNVQYNGKKIDGFDDLNRDLDRLIGMYKGNENTQNLYEQMKSALNEYVQTYNQDAIDRALTLASDIDGTLVGHSYTRKGSGKNSSKSQNNRVTTDFAEGDFIDTLLSYTNELRNMAKTNYESDKQNHNVNTAPIRNTYVEQTAQFGDKVSQTRTNTIENSGLASEQELKNYHAPEKFTYEQISEENSLNKATEKLNKYGQDYVNDILSSDNQNISGVDIDALMMEYRRLTESARKNGSDADWIRAQDILKKVQVASTRNAQALQALAKWSRNTPEGQLAQANTAIEQTIEKKFGKKRTQKVRETVEKVYEAAKSGNTEKIEYVLDKLNIDKRSIKQIALELGSKSSNLVKSEYALDNVNIDNNSIKQGSLDLGNNHKNTAKSEYALDKVDIDEKSIKQSDLQVENNQEITRNTVIELLANEGKINKKLAESLKEDTATQRKVLDMLEQMYDVGVDTYESQVIMARVGKLLSSKVQHTVGDKVRQILYNNMLGNFRTLISRNAGGNVAVATMEQARQPLAATIDRAVSHFTGKRTTTGWSKEKQLSYIKGFAKGITEEFRDVKNTLSEYKNGQSTGLHTAKSGENNIINAIKNNDSAFKGNNILSKFINFKNDMVKHGLSMGDRPFYESTKAQAKTEIKQLLKQGYDIDTDELNLDEYIEQASSLIALEAVYQGDTVLSKGFQGLRKDLSEITKGMIGVDIMSMPIFPFVKTPANVLDMAIEYSPFGFIKNIANTAIETKKGDGFNQRRFVDETSRNIVGTLLMSACVLAYSAGKFTGGYDDDKDVRNAQKAAGMQEYALSFDDGKKNFDVGWVPVLGSSVESGAAFGDAYKDGSGFLGATGAAMGQTAQSVFDQSMLESLSNLLGNNSYKDENFLSNAGKSIVGSALGMTTSSLGRQIAQSTDKYERNLGTYGTNEYYINSVLNSIPGARQLLDIKYDNEGKPVQQNQGRGIGSKLLENMLLPGNVTDVNYSDLSKESIRLFESTGEKKQFVPTASQSDIKNDNFTPTTEEFNEYKRILGENNSYGSAALMDSDFYQKLSDEEKVKYLSNIFSDMKMLAKKEVVPGYEFPEGDEKKMEIYDEAGIDGLVDYYSITNQRGDKTGINPTMSAIDNLDATEEEKGYYADKFLKPSASDSDKTALKKHNDVMKKYGYEGIYTYYTIKSRVDENDTSNAAKVSAVDSVNISDEDKGYYLSKMLDVSNAASAIQRTYGYEGLYKWYSMRSKVDKDSDMPYQIVKSGMPYEDMLNYASVLYEDGKKKTAREKAADAIRKAQDNISYYKVVERVNEILGGKTDEEKAAEKESKIQNKVSNIYGGSSNYYEIANRVNEILDGNSSKNNTSYESVSERVNQILDRNSKSNQSYEYIVNRVNAILDKNKAFSLTPLN